MLPGPSFDNFGSVSIRLVVLFLAFSCAWAQLYAGTVTDRSTGVSSRYLFRSIAIDVNSNVAADASILLAACRESVAVQAPASLVHAGDAVGEPIFKNRSFFFFGFNGVRSLGGANVINQQSFDLKLDHFGKITAQANLPRQAQIG